MPAQPHTDRCHRADELGEDGASDRHRVAHRPSKAGTAVSARLTWEELDGGEVHPQSFRLLTTAERLAAVGNLWATCPVSHSMA